MKLQLIYILLILLGFSCFQTSKKPTKEISENSVIEKAPKSTVPQLSEKKELVQYSTDEKISRLTTPINCPEYNFSSPKIHAKILTGFYDSLVIKRGNEQREYEQKFFCAFPNSFHEMETLFGFGKEAAPLYSSLFVDSLHSNWSSHHAMINHFSSLNSVESQQYYTKYINICVNGNWQADNIRKAFGFAQRLLNNTDAVCPILAKKSDKDIKSVFRFIFDGPHPVHEVNQNMYNKLLPVITEKNEHLGKLLTDAYTQLMSENHNH